MTRLTRTAAQALVPCALALAVGQAYAQSLPPVLPVQVASPTQPTRGSATCRVGATGPCTSTYTAPNAMVVNQSSQNVIINWESFNIGAGSSVQFIQPNTSSIALNRVTGGGGRDTIAGSLTANGRIFISDPNGMLITSTGSINTGGLIATTMAITDDDFQTGAGSMATGAGGTGRFRFTQGAFVGNDVFIRNDGNITVNGGGAAALLGVVVNTGTITATGGTVAMANAATITFELQPTNVASVSLDTVGHVLNNDVEGLSAGVTNIGTLSANGGQVLIATDLGLDGPVGIPPRLGYGSQLTGLIEAQTGADGTPGTVSIISNATPTQLAGLQVDLRGLSAGQTGGTAIISSDSGVDIGSVTRLIVDSPFTIPTAIVTDGTAGGGGIAVTSSNGALTIDGRTVLAANATTAGDGGTININGNGRMDLTPIITARGAGTGSGGQVSITQSSETQIMNLIGISVDASSASGPAGTLTVSAPDLRISHADNGGEEDFTPEYTLFADGTINRVLNTGTNVTAHGITGGESYGYLEIEAGVAINRTVGTRPVTLSLQADLDIYNDGGFTIGSTSGALNVSMRANASNLYTDGQVSLYSTTVATNGGNLDLTALRQGDASDVDDPRPAIQVNYTTLDTRSSPTVGGNITITGSTYTGSGVEMTGANLTSASGNISITGNGNLGFGSAVAFFPTEGPNTRLTTTTGSISIAGIGDRYQHFFIDDGEESWGSMLSYVNLTTGSGAINLVGGSRTGTTEAVLGGLLIGSNADITSTSGAINLTGSSFDGGTGLSIQGTVNAGSGPIVLRAAANDGVKSILVDGTVSSTGVVDVRPGRVGEDNESRNDVDTAINLGTTAVGAGASLDLTNAELNNISASTLVIGHNQQNGNITIVGNVTRPGNLTLETNGAISLNGATDVGTSTLGLLAGRNIVQTAPITASQLQAESSAGSVTLTNAANNVATVSGVGFPFNYTDANGLTIGNVTVAGSDGEGLVIANTRNGVTGGNVVIRTLSGNLNLAANVQGGDIDLISAGIFNNTGTFTLGAEGSWRIWADTYVGENRGGLAGSGPLPNLYNCSYLGACGVTVTTDANHFIYRIQPTATVVIGNANREYGLVNPGFTFITNGVRAGDTAGNVVSGAPTTAATIGSNVGNYAIGGTFTSAAGYLVVVQNGTLRIDPATLTYVATPTTRQFGAPNVLTGTVTGYRNGDTQQTATSGNLTFTSPADAASPAGSYQVNGGGLTAGNYVFVQAPGNATALTVVGVPPRNRYAETIARVTDVEGATSLGGVFYGVERNPPQTYVYDRNFSPVPICLASDPTTGKELQGGDALAIEWSRVKSRPNLTNCVATDKTGGCSDF